MYKVVELLTYIPTYLAFTLCWITITWGKSNQYPLVHPNPNVAVLLWLDS